MSSQPHRLPRPSGNEKDGNQCLTLPFCSKCQNRDYLTFFDTFGDFLAAHAGQHSPPRGRPPNVRGGPERGVQRPGRGRPEGELVPPRRLLPPLLQDLPLPLPRLGQHRLLALTVRSLDGAPTVGHLEFEFQTYSFRYGKCLGNLVFKVKIQIKTLNIHFPRHILGKADNFPIKNAREVVVKCSNPGCNYFSIFLSLI